MKPQKSIYISHAWGGTSDEILAELVPRLEAEKIAFILDKRDLGYRQSIREFMIRLGKADMVIIILSNKYLKSEYCMFELIQIYKNENLADRIFPIVLDEVKISSSVDRLEFVKYWENQLTELQNKVKELNSLSYIEGITDDLNLYSEIRNNIARLTGILRDLNTLNISLHHESDYRDLIEGIRKKINEQPAVVPVTPKIESNPEPISSDIRTIESTTAKTSKGIPVMARNLVIVALALFGLFMLWGILSKSTSLANNNSQESNGSTPADSSKPLNSDQSDLHIKDTSKISITENPVVQPPVTDFKKSVPPPNNTKNQKPEVVHTIPSTPPEVKKETDTVKVKANPTQQVLTHDERVKNPEMTHSTIIAKGTLIVARCNVSISSDDPEPVPRKVSFVLDKPIYDGSNVVVPAGSSVIATILKVRKSDYKKVGTMDLNFERIIGPGGQIIPLAGNEMHLEAKGTVPYEIKVNTKLQVKTTANVTLRY